MNKQLTYNQTYEIIERALHWNRENPDFFYSPERRPHIFSIALATVCDYFGDVSPGHREDFVSLFIQAYKEFSLLNSGEEEDFDEDSFRELILNNYSDVLEELEMYKDNEESYINFLLVPLGKKFSIPMIPDSVIDDLRKLNSDIEDISKKPMNKDTQVLKASFLKKELVDENAKCKYLFHYLIKGDEEFKEKLIEQKRQYVYKSDEGELIWKWFCYCGKVCPVLISGFSGKLYLECTELRLYDSLAEQYPALYGNYWKDLAKKENDNNWLTRYDCT